VPAADRVTIKKGLPSLLGSAHSKIRTTVSQVIATIASYDFPEQWPELLPGLLQCLASDSSAHVVQGALRCVELISEDVIEVVQAIPVLTHGSLVAPFTPTHIPHPCVVCVQSLFPVLLKILTAAKPYPERTQMRTLAVYRKTAVSLLHMREEQKMSTVMQQYLVPTLSGWLSAIVRLIDPAFYPKTQVTHTHIYAALPLWCCVLMSESGVV
jgi:hypothetical protein